MPFTPYANSDDREQPVHAHSLAIAVLKYALKYLNMLKAENEDWLNCTDTQTNLDHRRPHNT